MAEKASNVVLNFKMDGQVQYAETLKQINTVMNTAAKEYKNHIAAMGKEGSATDKLRAEKKKLEIQMEGAQKRTKMLSDEYEAMSKDTNTTTEELDKMYGKLLDSERAEISLQKSMDRVNEGLSEQAIEARDAKESLNELQDESKVLEAEQKNLTSAFKLQKAELGENASEAEKMELAQRQLAAQMDLSERTISNMEDQLVKTKAAYGDNSVEVMQLEAKLNDARTTVTKFSSSLDEVEDGGNNAADGISELGNKLDAANFMEATDKLGELTGQLTDLATASFDAAKEVDDLAAKHNKAFGLTGDEAERTKDRIVDLYNSGFVDSYEEANEAITETREQLRGVNTENLDLITQKAVAFSKTFDTDLQESLRGVNGLMGAFGLTVDESFDLMTVGAQNGLNKTDELGDNIAEYANQFAQSGYSASEMFEMLEAGLSGGAYNLDKVNDLVKEFGVRVSDSTIKDAVGDLGGEWESMYDQMNKDGASSQEIFEAMAGKIAEVGDETEKATLVSTIFGSLGEDNAVQVIEAMSGLSKEMTGVEGAYEDVAGASDELTESSAADTLNQMWREFVDVLRPVGEVMLDMATNVAPPLINIFQAIGEWFANTNPIIQQFITIFGLILIGLTAVLPVFLGLSAAAALAGVSIGTLLASFAAMIAPIILGAAALTALVLGIKYLWDTNEGFRTAIVEIWNNIMSVIMSVVQIVVDFVMSIWGTLVTWWNENNALIMQTVNTVWNFISGIIQGVMNVIVPLIQTAWSTVQLATSVAWELIKGYVKMALDVILGVIKAVMQMINGDWKGAWKTIAETVLGVLNNVSKTVANVIGAIASNIGNVFNGVLSTVKGIWDNIYDSIAGTINKAKDVVSGAIDAIKGFMNFEWSLPKLKMPKVSVDMKENSWGIPYPHFNIKWNAKGGIFTQPTIFGASGGQLQGIGEAGPEAALPLNEETLGDIGRGIAATMNMKQPAPTGPIYLQVNGRTFAELTGKDFSNYNGQEVRLIERGLAT